jgi:isopentenyl phosphate kinase
MNYLKLGGSLITEKNMVKAARLDTIQRLAMEIADARRSNPDMKLIIGHGSGSFGHHVAQQYHTNEGVVSPEDWAGFLEVWQAAGELNEICMQIFKDANLPVMSFSPSASAICEDGALMEVAVTPIELSVEHGLIPVVHGDVAFDRVRGGSIVSTEQVFRFLATIIPPARVLLAGREDGVYAQPAEKSGLLSKLTPSDLETLDLAHTEGADVTGGMSSKVTEAMKIAKHTPLADVRIFSAEKSDSLRLTLLGDTPGTKIQS